VIIFRYQTGELIEVGDEIRINRWFRRSLRGVVDYVHDPTKPAPRGGDNEIGFSVHHEDGSWSWFGATSPPPRVELLRKKAKPDDK